LKVGKFKLRNYVNIFGIIFGSIEGKFFSSSTIFKGNAGKSDLLLEQFDCHYGSNRIKIDQNKKNSKFSNFEPINPKN
jgi:hypothetical protein